MTAALRWLVVAFGVALIIGVPLAVRAIPANDSRVSAGTLLEQVRSSASTPYSGYVETLGTLRIPVADSFTDVGALFGERTRMRVWWRGADDWRVDKVLATGETNLFHTASGTALWEYEKSRVTWSRDPDIRLPRHSDLLPPELARRLLEDVDREALARIPTERIAGRDAPGLRLSPRAPQSSVAHVDVWVDPTSGLPLRLAVYAKGEDDTAAFTSTFMQFSADPVSSAVTTLTRPPGADVDYDDVIDIADAANQYAHFAPPRSLAGLAPSSDARLRAVGVYGAGVTQLIAIPLWDEAAGPLREQMEITPGTRRIAEGDVLSVGPLGILLTRFPYDDGGWLIAGTVTEKTLTRAAHEIDRFQVVLR